MTTRTLSIWMLGLLVVGAVACSKDNEIDASKNTAGGIGTQCSGPDDPACGTNGVCALGYCRIGCLTDGECEQGALCIGDVPPFGCQLPQDAVCNDSDRRCRAPLVCGLDYTCRMACQESRDCPRNDQECYAGVCVGDSEKGEAAKAYRSCEEGQTRCGSDGEDCVDGHCEVLGCNMTAPGWAVVEKCPDEKAFCVEAKCQWEDPRCTTGETRCVTPDWPKCIPRQVESCNTVAPGWAVVQDCVGDAPFCQDAQCGGAAPQAPGPIVQVSSPLGGTYGMDVTEVTEAQYWMFALDRECDASGQPPECDWNEVFYGGAPLTVDPTVPVTNVDWCDARAYCEWAGKRLCGRIGGGPITVDDATLASKSQWYNACSSGGQNAYPYGNEWQEGACHLSGSTNDPQPVGSAMACESSVSGYAGVLDLVGNAWEWEDACLTVAGQPDRCLVRGASIGLPDEPSHDCAYRTAADRNQMYSDIGFRCCSDP